VLRPSGPRKLERVKTLVIFRRDRREAVFLFFAYVRFWPLADMGECTANVHFWG
jgi:hypothetical protein